MVRLGTHPESPGHPSALVTGDVNNTQAMTAPLSLATSRTSRTPVEAHKQRTGYSAMECLESITFGLHCRCDAEVGCICMSEMMMMMEAQTENIEGMSVR